VYLLYDLILLASSVVLVPYYLLRGLRYGKTRRGIRERLGFFAPDRLAPLAGKKVFWVHAVSVGETRAAIPLVHALKQAYPECAVLISNVTETGHAVAETVREADLCIFFPFDLSFVVRRVLRQIRPTLLIIVETEIWPNFVRCGQAQRIPVALVNGRLSDRSFPRYLRVRFLMAPLLRKFSAFCMQSELDAERMRRLGADPTLVEVTHNLKFDMEAPLPDAAEVARLRTRYRLPATTRVLVAGSTHAGEEEVLVAAYQQLLAAGRDLVLILVPRHPERCRTVVETLGAAGVPCALRSEVEERGESLPAGGVLVGDTLGEMLKYYAVADLVFVGGSLVPVGGHNVLEASLVGKPVLFGPHMHNFKEISRLLLEVGGGLQVAGGEELARELARLLDDPEGCAAMGARGRELLAANVGATAHTLRVLRDLVGEGTD
jgi:3-deoxy-D-manno-octulosonic-acid transferase